MSFTLSARAAVLYVDVNSTTPAWPYADWSSAAVTIQDAVDASAAGDEIVVTNGVYQTGGRVVYGALTNRVAVTKAVTVRSVNGPEVTVICGYQVPGTTNGDAAVRCVYLTNDSAVIGFTLTNGATRADDLSYNEQEGGGVWCEADSSVVSNCVLTGNSAASGGGGSRYGTLNHCTLASNSAYGSGGGSLYGTMTNCTFVRNSSYDGGGAARCTLNNCTLVGNVAEDDGGGAMDSTLSNCAVTGNSASNSGGGASVCTLKNCTVTGNTASIAAGGAYRGSLNNCIVYYNRAALYPNYYDVSAYNCCTTPLPDTGTRNINAEPQLASTSHLSANSPCRGAGSTYDVTGTDIDGETWAKPPSIGCDEFDPGAVTGDLSVSIQTSLTNVAVGYTMDLMANTGGKVTGSQWEFDDGTVMTNRAYAARAWGAAGDYAVVLRAFNNSYPSGVSATAIVHVVSQPIHYVALNSPGPSAPYGSWATAATNIQDAVDAATVPGALVLVGEGVYGVGGRVVSGFTSNRVAVTKPLVVEGVNGPGVTVIRGYQVPDTTNGDGAVRCVYLVSGATLTGFTLTNGATAYGNGMLQEGVGGGVWCASPWAMVSNCVLAGNSAANAGGGAYLGTLNDCTLTGNWTVGGGGGAYLSILNHCTLTRNSAGDSYGLDYARGGGADWATLNNCTLTGNSAYLYGGATSFGTLNNCTLTGNSAWNGGGAYCGTLNNCVLTGNSAFFGGGAFQATLNNCTLTANSASVGGGGWSNTLNNCIAWYNRAPYGPNYSGSTLSYCCTTPLPDGGPGNIEAEPQLAGASHLSASSSCRGAGSTAYLSGMDIDGEPWANPPSIGCDELRLGSATGGLSVSLQAAYTNVATGFAVELTASIVGSAMGSLWEFGDGTVVSNEPYASHAWTGPGNYAVVLRAYNDSNPGGVSATVAVHVVSQPVHYVALTSTAPAAPYSSWATAATNIQDAVDVETVPGALVLVSNGVYGAGGRVVFGAMSNRLAVTIPTVVRSVNGPGVTIIQGYQVPETYNGDSAIRCAYLASGSTLAGFTLTKGATRSTGDFSQEQSGGGVWCASTSVVVSNCVLTFNAATAYGGGAYSGTLNNCRVTSNWGAWEGGGVNAGILNNCILTDNNGGHYGGAVFAAMLNNCTLTGNYAWNGCGAYYGTLYNCIVYSNEWSNYDASTLNYCCTTPLPGRGIGNFTNDPAFLDLASGNLRLGTNSPCINAGSDAYVIGATDLDGRPRVVGRSVDVGAYEFQPGVNGPFLGWLDQYGLPTDGSVDFADTDGDGLNNWHEWIAGTVPTNRLSVLRMLTPAAAGTNVAVRWESVAGVNYFLERSTDLAAWPRFQLLATNIVGEAGTTTYTDVGVAGPSPLFYRVGAGSYIAPVNHPQPMMEK